MKKLMFMALLVGAISVQAQTDDNQYLNAQSTNGTTCVELSSVQKITFTSENAVIKVSGGDDVLLPLAELQKITFSATPTAIEELKGETEGLAVNNGYVTISENGNLYVYSMKGQLVGIAQVKKGQSVSLSSLPQGSYIIKMGSKAIKITK